MVKEGNMKLQARCAKIKLKPGSLERVREWAHTLHVTRRAEALETLRAETVILESYYLDRTPQGDYLIAFMLAQNFETAHRAVEESTHDIDRYHQAFKEEVWDSLQPLELLVELERIGELSDPGPSSEREKG
jgi:hypothetical protein